MGVRAQVLTRDPCGNSILLVKRDTSKLPVVACKAFLGGRVMVMEAGVDDVHNAGIDSEIYAADVCRQLAEHEFFFADVKNTNIVYFYDDDGSIQRRLCDLEYVMDATTMEARDAQCIGPTYPLTKHGTCLRRLVRHTTSYGYLQMWYSALCSAIYNRDPAKGKRLIFNSRTFHNAVLPGCRCHALNERHPLVAVSKRDLSKEGRLYTAVESLRKLQVVTRESVLALINEFLD